MKYNDLKLYVKCDIKPCAAMRQVKINGPFKRSSPIGAERLLMDTRKWVYITGTKAKELAERLENVPYYVEGTESAAIDDSRKYIAEFIVYASDMNAYDGWALQREVSMYGGERIIVVDEAAKSHKTFEAELKAEKVRVYGTLQEAANFLNGAKYD